MNLKTVFLPEKVLQEFAPQSKLQHYTSQLLESREKVKQREEHHIRTREFHPISLQSTHQALATPSNHKKMNLVQYLMKTVDIRLIYTNLLTVKLV